LLLLTVEYGKIKWTLSCELYKAYSRHLINWTDGVKTVYTEFKHLNGTAKR